MRQYLLALALAAGSLVLTATGRADTTYAAGYHEHQPQSCVTKRIHTESRDGRVIGKRVRICQ